MARESLQSTNTHTLPFFFSFPCFQCLSNEFGCSNGLCIPMRNRCDEIENCLDKSDETFCEIFTLDSDRYRNEYPPILTNGSGLPVNIDVTIYSIGSFEEIGMTYRVNFLIKIKWYDERITFVNLKDPTQKVVITISDLFWPL